ncbi:MAG: diphthine--ammonia ligase [Cytophagaceae bacterium]|nr:diphthine--ammonia ligase [Cytophagaceae bacterium]
MNKEKAIFCWSGGKDSALALYKILNETQYDVIALLTTVNKEFQRVSMHGVREILLEEQARQINIPLEKIYVDTNCSNNTYEMKMEEVLLRYKASGVAKVIFGDIFLEDLRQYRENNLKKVNMEAVFPLWKRNTRELIFEFIDLGFKTVICCTNNTYLPDHFAGRVIDKALINSLPSEVDPCGENGEFHTFTFGGPIFKKPVAIQMGEKVLKTYEIKTMKNGKEIPELQGYWFADILPA